VQGHPQNMVPMSPPGGPVAGVPYPAAPVRPCGIAPAGDGFTAGAALGLGGPGAAQFGWPQGVPGPQGYPPPIPGMPLPGAPAPGWPAQGFPSVARVPSCVGTYPQAPVIPGSDGVQGVTVAPITGVTAPAATGGPHPLPNPPQFPLPQGFPNPFAVQQLTLGAPAPQAPAAQAPGLTVTTGPQGYLPGLGFFGPGAQSGPGPVPTAPHPLQPQVGRPFMGAPVQPSVSAAPPAPAPAPAAPNPFWVNLAWQLMQTPAVRQRLGSRADPLVTGDERLRTLGVALSSLAGPEVQEAFRALTAGTMDQARFIETFAERLKAALGAAGML